MKPFKTLCRLRLATLPSTSLSPWTSLNYPLSGIIIAYPLVSTPTEFEPPWGQESSYVQVPCSVLTREYVPSKYLWKNKRT